MSKVAKDYDALLPEMIRLREEGKTINEIGEELHISRPVVAERIGHIPIPHSKYATPKVSITKKMGSAHTDRERMNSGIKKNEIDIVKDELKNKENWYLICLVDGESNGSPASNKQSAKRLKISKTLPNGVVVDGKKILFIPWGDVVKMKRLYGASYLTLTQEEVIENADKRPD